MVFLFVFRKKKKISAPSTGPPKSVPMCELCGKTFSNENNYVKHTEDHHGEEQLQCPKCPKILLHKVS
jgi:uncharacterized Zn-finger protein